MIGICPLCVQRNLQFFPPPKLLLGPAACGGNTPDPVNPLRVNKNHEIATITEPRLIQLWGIQYNGTHHRVGVVRLHQLFPPSHYAGIQ